MNPGIGAQPNHVAPARAPLKPAEQLGTGKGTIGQHSDRVEPREQTISPLQQHDHHLSADAGTGMLQRLPEQWNGPAVADHGDHHDAEAVPEHRGVERQMQGVALILPLLQCPEHQRTVERLGVDAAVGEPTPAAPLPAGRQATVQRNGSLPLAKTDGLAEQQTGDHSAQGDQMALVANRAVLTEEACELSMEPGMGIHEGLDWCENPQTLMAPCPPNDLRPTQCRGSGSCVRQSGKTLGDFWAQMDLFVYILAQETSEIFCGATGLALFKRAGLTTRRSIKPSDSSSNKNHGASFSTSLLSKNHWNYYLWISNTSIEGVN